MIEVFGDLWTFKPEAGHVDARVIATNGVVNNGKAVMGRGSALEAALRFPGIEFNLGELIKNKGNRVHVVGERLDLKNWSLVSFPTKNDWRENSDLTLIQKSAVQLLDLANKHEWTVVVMPRIGAGAGNLRWDDVKRRIRGLLDDRFYVITFAPDDRRSF